MGARQSNPESEALITSGEALQLNVDPLSPAFLANTVMRSLILGGGTPTASMKRALGWLKHDRQARGAAKHQQPAKKDSTHAACSVVSAARDIASGSSWM